VAGRSFAVDRHLLPGTVPKKGCHINGERLYLALDRDVAISPRLFDTLSSHSFSGFDSLRLMEIL